jgi:predicted AAA+ superfamily ATPase
VTYFDFKDDRFDHDRSLRDALEARPPGYRTDAPRLILLDEVTQAPRWDLSLKAMVDEARSDPPSRRSRILVTDSAASLLRSGAMESLQGRVDEVRIHGLTFEEALHLQGVADEAPQRVLVRAPGALELFLQTGGMPEHIVLPDDPARTREQILRRTWGRIRGDVVDKAIARDMARQGVDIERITALFRALVEDAGSLFEASSRAQDLPKEEGRGPDARTVRKWVDLLQQASLIDRILPWHPGIKRGSTRTSRALKSRTKVFAEDHGFIPAFSPLAFPPKDPGVMGKIFENVVFTHLRWLQEERGDHGLYYFREQDQEEIDFVLGFQDAVLGLEVTSSKSLDKKRASIERAARRAGVDRMILVHGAPQDVRELGQLAEWPIGAFLLDPGGCIERSLEWVRASR